MSIIDKAVTSYLNHAGFDIFPERRKYLKRYVIDYTVATVYSALSMICLIIDKATLIVLLLNSLCLVRVIIKNAIKSSELTDWLEKNCGHRMTGKYHYFHNAVAQFTLCVVAAIIVIVMNCNTDKILIRILTGMIIIFVWLDDLESALINVLGAEIVPLVNKEWEGKRK